MRTTALEDATLAPDDHVPSSSLLARLCSGPDEDTGLLHRARMGDATALDQLVHRHYARLFNIAYRLCGHYDDAQDLVGETFLRASRAIREFRGDAHFTTWLYSILKNVFLSQRKRQRLRDHTSLDDLVQLDERSVYRQIEDPAPGPEALAEREEQAAAVQLAVADLPEAQRLLVVLYHFQHCSYEEIAEITALPVGTVKSRLNRARLFLKGRLARQRELLGIPPR